MKEKEFYKSTRFWAMVFGMVLPVFNNVFSLGLNVPEIVASISSGMVYIGGQSYKDSVKIKAAALKGE